MAEKTFSELFAQSEFDPGDKYMGNGRIPKSKRKKRVSITPTKPQRRIDLHGMSRKDALDEVFTFLQRANAEGLLLVQIITGKGTGTLQETIRKYLNVNPQKYVKKFKHPKNTDGGTGAFNVWLK